MAGLLDNDLYKLTMQHAVRELHPGARALYRFLNRRPSDRFGVPGGRFERLLRERVSALGEQALREDEADYLRGLGLFPEAYVDFLKKLRLDPANQVRLEVDAEGGLAVEVEGLWQETILYEVPLMALISETYFEVLGEGGSQGLTAFEQRTREKGRALAAGGCRFADFGTRRRRSYAAQERAVEALFEGASGAGEGAFTGTSNVHLARRAGVPPVGTMAHEWVMGHAGLGGVRGANRRSMDGWQAVYGDKLLVALTDTYTTELFFEEFRGELARAFDGLRHDSGCPFAFTEKAEAFYRGEGIDPAGKRVVYSDGLDVEAALEIQRRCAGRVDPFFGIGTHFTNDFPGRRALNMVIKLHRIDGRPVAKLSDVEGKASGEPEAVEEAAAAVRRPTSPRP